MVAFKVEEVAIGYSNTLIIDDQVYQFLRGKL